MPDPTPPARNPLHLILERMAASTDSPKVRRWCQAMLCGDQAEQPTRPEAARTAKEGVR